MFRRRVAIEVARAKGREGVIAENVRLNVGVAIVLTLLLAWAQGLVAGAVMMVFAIPLGYWAGRERGRRYWKWVNSWDE